MTSFNSIEVLNWIRPIQQALTIEAEKGFTDLMGRKENFHLFISRELSAPPDFILEKDKKELFDSLSKSFLSYSSIPFSARKRLVTKTRQALYSLTKTISYSNKVAPPKISFCNEPNQCNFSIENDKYQEHLIGLDTLISDIKGVGKKNNERLANLGLIFVRDLLEYFPRDYVDYSTLSRIVNLEEGTTATIVANVRRCGGFKSPRNPNLAILELSLSDVTGRIKVTKFLAGRRFSSQAYLQGKIHSYPVGSTVAVSGLVKSGRYGKTIIDPLIEVMDSTNYQIKSKSIGRLLPVYSLTEGISSDRFRELIEVTLPLASKYPEVFSQTRLEELNLIGRSEAITLMHRPKNQTLLKGARRRLVFEEFLFLQLGLLMRRNKLRVDPSPPVFNTSRKEGLVGRFLELLPFELTNAQSRVIKEIEVDLERQEPMARLVQGDVGSGKTLVALIALLHSVEAGWQGALMAPTEVLAEQHYRTLCKWLIHLHVNVELLTGSTPRSRRKNILDDLSNGSIKILVGTHALIEDPVEFSRLGLVVVDEQHRFGVRQRNRLMNKGLQPHLLTMTATPIPRTLALSLHGDLDVSQIDELPPGRKPISTSLLSKGERHNAYELIRNQVLKGFSAYFVLPLVEDSEKLDLRSAIEVHRQLSEEIFPDFNVGLLHGRMNSLEKKSVIDSFSSGTCQILVSTTVVEVGLDVPKATVMVIDHAERFGLAQLHQLRGRVGRGGDLSHCLLINETSNPLAKQRLEVLERSSDGFEISEIDLRFRGPGQVLGTRQSGLPDFVLASLIDDADVLQEAREEAIKIINSDPNLLKNSVLRLSLQNHWKDLKANLYLN